MTAAKIKLKDYLVAAGIAETSERAEALVLGGYIYVDGQPARSSGQVVRPDNCVTVHGLKQYVGRGALKLEHALDVFDIQVSRRVCADIGASTGGFTQILLKAGASKVFAVDVAYGELAWSLRKDPRVVVLERTNARLLDALPQKVSVVTVDVSFISLALILPKVPGWLEEHGPRDIIVLVKPQFETPAENVPEGGIVRDPRLHRAAVEKIADCAKHLHFPVRGLAPSPIEGAEGNREFLLWLQPGTGDDGDLSEMFNRAGLGGS